MTHIVAVVLVETSSGSVNGHAIVLGTGCTHGTMLKYVMIKPSVFCCEFGFASCCCIVFRWREMDVIQNQ